MRFNITSGKIISASAVSNDDFLSRCTQSPVSSELVRLLPLFHLLNRVLWQKCIVLYLCIVFSRLILRAMLVGLLAAVYTSERSLPCYARKWASGRPVHPRIRPSIHEGFFPPFYRIGIVAIADDLVFLFEGCSKAPLTFSKKTASLVLFHYYYYYFNLMTLYTKLSINVNPNRMHSLCWWWTSTQIWSRLWQKKVQIWIRSSVVHVTEIGILVCSVQDLLKMKKRDGWWWWWCVVGKCMFILLSAMKFGCTSQGGAGGRMVSISTCLYVHEKKFHLAAILAASVKAEPPSLKRSLCLWIK